MLIPDSGKWNFHYWSHQGRLKSMYDLFRKPITMKAKGRLAARLDYLTQHPKPDWCRPHASPLSDNKYVIRFQDQNRTQQRLFGHFYDNHDTFVITLAGYEKDDTYHPTDYATKCANRKLECDNNFIECTRPMEGRCTICCQPRNNKTISSRSPYVQRPPA